MFSLQNRFTKHLFNLNILYRRQISNAKEIGLVVFICINRLWNGHVGFEIKLLNRGAYPKSIIPPDALLLNKSFQLKENQTSITFA